jgi:hypothetical protein
VTTTHHLVWNWVPDNTTECYDRARDPAETHDLWGRLGGGDVDGACADLKGQLQRLVTALALPPGAAEKMARGVTPPGEKAPPPSHAVSGTIGDQIGLLGYDVSPEAAAPGGEVTLTLHFAVKQRLDAGWKLFFHLEGPGGFRNLDHVPVEGMMPLERWRPGQTIRDVQHVFMPTTSPKGTYTVFVGAFRGAEHLAVGPPALKDPAGRLRVGSFQIK